MSDHDTILLDVALQFGAMLDLDNLLPLVVERVAALADAERALVVLCDDEGNIERAIVHNIEWAGPGHPLPVSQGVITRAVRERRAVMVADGATDADFGTNESVKSLGLRLIVAAPVLSRDRVVGALYTDSKVKILRHMNDKIALLTALSRLVGTAVDNARLFEEQRFRAMLLAEMAHDLRTPLQVVMGNAQIAMLGAAGEQAAVLADIEASAQRMARMIDAALELSRIDAGASCPPPAQVDLAEELPRHARMLDVVARQSALELRIVVGAGLPPAVTSLERLWVILDNLLFNAFKHAFPGTPVSVEVALRDDAGPPEARSCPGDPSATLFRRAATLVPHPSSRFLEISVHNHGRPIAADLLPGVFSAYERGDERQSGHKSTGLGLCIVEKCVRHLGGLVWVTSEASRGTRFAFTLPTRLAQP